MLLGGHGEFPKLLISCVSVSTDERFTWKLDFENDGLVVHRCWSRVVKCGRCWSHYSQIHVTASWSPPSTATEREAALQLRPKPVSQITLKEYTQLFESLAGLRRRKVIYIMLLWPFRYFQVKEHHSILSLTLYWSSCLSTLCVLSSKLLAREDKLRLFVWSWLFVKIIWIICFLINC